jgi:hypothetical protein
MRPEVTSLLRLPLRLWRSRPPFAGITPAIGGRSLSPSSRHPGADLLREGAVTPALLRRNRLVRARSIAAAAGAPGRCASGRPDSHRDGPSRCRLRGRMESPRIQRHPRRVRNPDRMEGLRTGDLDARHHAAVDRTERALDHDIVQRGRRGGRSGGAGRPRRMVDGAAGLSLARGPSMAWFGPSTRRCSDTGGLQCTAHLYLLICAMSRSSPTSSRSRWSSPSRLRSPMAGQCAGSHRFGVLRSCSRGSSAAIPSSGIAPSSCLSRFGRHPCQLLHTRRESVTGVGLRHGYGGLAAGSGSRDGGRSARHID